MSDPRLAILRKTGDSDVQWLIARIDELEREGVTHEQLDRLEELVGGTLARVAVLEEALRLGGLALDEDGVLWDMNSNNAIAEVKIAQPERQP